MESTIPLKIWQTLPSLELSPTLKMCVEKLKIDNPEFEHYLFDHIMCEEFIKEHFSKDVWIAYNDLIPNVYKADLWRLCVLYIHGGIYLDIRLQCENDFKLITLTDKEYYVWDGKYKNQEIEYDSVYNGLIVSKKNNHILFDVITQIVDNVMNRQYGSNPYIVTGSQLLGKCVTPLQYTFEYIHYGPKQRETIRHNDKIVMGQYSEYSKCKDNSANDDNHYLDLWTKRKIYRNDPENIQRCSRINIFIAYYGSFPNYFQLYLDSLAINDDILTVYFITDIDMSGYRIPKNCKSIWMTLEVLREKFSNFLLKEFGKTLPGNELIYCAYKLCDLKILYPVLFDQILIDHDIREYDYVGWGDCDVIYGKFSNFINNLGTFDIIGGYHGHFAAIKNIPELKNMFKSIDNIYQLLIDTKTYIIDEIAARKHIEKLKMFYINKYFTDIVPPCFFNLFRKDHKQRKKNFFDVYNHEKDIRYLFYDKIKEKLFTMYDDGTTRETIYVHLQKRPMELSFTESNSGYWICENSFSIHEPITTNPKIRLHIPAIPHTITHHDFSHCAFTGKVQRFPKMMQSVGYEVYHYGIESSLTDATKDIVLLNKDEWNALRIESLISLDPKLSPDDAKKKLDDPAQFVGLLANWSTPLYKKFNERFREKLQENYRGTSTDIVCVPLGKSYNDATQGLGFVEVEIGIGYSNSCKNYRIFESYAWLHNTLAKDTPRNYWFVAPYSHDSIEFQYTPQANIKRIGFLGRIGNHKGCNIIVQIAKLFPDIEFVLCGQGDPKPYCHQPNIKYKLPIHGKERSDYLGNLIAFLYPTTYLEPFGAAVIEAQMCGTPVITCDCGGMVETVENFKTGLRCHTLADYRHGVQMALNGEFDRQYIRNRAIKLYDIHNVAKQYDYILKSILEIHNGNNGWYSPHTYIDHLI